MAEGSVLREVGRRDALRLALAGALGAGSLGARLALAQEQPAQPFPQWLAGLRAEAARAGIRPRTLDVALAGLQPIPRVIELDRKQPESTISFETYVGRVVTGENVEHARRLLAQHRALLARVARTYGVPAKVIVALWGMESGYGATMGGFHVVGSLATLAYDGRRAALFRGELIDALKIIDHGDVTAAAMLGSWAGAMGQVQFMPSTYLRYAVDGNADGRRDIWHSEADIFASAANFLKGLGWQAGHAWGREVVLPVGFDAAAVGKDVRPLAAFAALGVRTIDGRPLPAADEPAALALPDGAGGRAFLAYDNFRAIMKWNRSTYFATTAGLFSDRIGDVA